ncbi:alpha/beta hydrolase [Zooshikella marina]|uniref:alpha/beta hydrolase n=1 Tax=Zooshikella ganghwensis TaxID=202772 RepID=UPI001BAE7E1A|nr:alpha/beta fold hydrolase [Zooshikella ganghwensis]MBU2709212.1 alpha/beta hydrolase [Zooshikella ganghwensis]
MRNIAIIFVFAIFVLCALVFGIGFFLAKPVNQVVHMPRGFDSVVYKGTHGSLLKAGTNEVCALLMHGVRSNRSSMVDRSLFLREHSITSLLIDLQAHGETPGDMITFGIRESQDATNGVEYLRQVEKCNKIVAIGQSLGGASALLGNGPINVDAFILESVYPTIEEAVENRIEIRLGKVGRLLAPLLYWQIPLRIDSTLSELRPIDVLPNVKVPVFIISGTNDKHTKPEEAKRMYEVVRVKKQLWLVDGASHEDIFAFDTVNYKNKVLSFIKDSL